MYLTKNNFDNDLRGGLSVIASLHFGDFAGYTLRIVFFILGIGTCYIILTGNLMWIKKRASLRKEKQSWLGLRVVKAMTTGGFIGTLFATAIGFLCARTLPITLVDRSEVIVQIFFACLTLSILTSIFIEAQKQFAAIFLKITAVVMILVPITDWLMLSQQITLLFNEGYYSVFIVNIMLVSLSICCWLISVKLSTSKQSLLDVLV